MKINILAVFLSFFLFILPGPRGLTAQTLYGAGQAAPGQPAVSGTPSGGNLEAVTRKGLICLQQGNYSGAYQAFTRAALQGHPEAQLHLGVMFFNGEGVPRDPVEAYAWYTLAMQAGNRQAAAYARDAAGMLGPQDRLRAQQRVQLLLSTITAGRGPQSSIPPNPQTQPVPAAGTRERRLPPAYQAVDPSGRVMTVKFPVSARALMTKVLGDLYGYFGGHLNLLGAFDDDLDRDAQFAFSAGRNGARMKGVVFARVGPGENGRATIIVGPSERFDGDFEALCKTYLGGESAQGGPPPPQQVRWRRVSYGQGAIRLPSGWRITGTNAQGAVDAAGPDGSGVSLGIYFPVFSALQGPYPLKAPYMGPVQAVKVLSPRILAQSHVVLNDLRILEAAPAGWYTPVPGGQAAMIVWQSDVTAGGKRLRFKGLALVLTAPIDYSQWMYYYSTVHAPVESFDRMLPVLMEIWCSWKIDDAVFRRRLRSAAQSLRTVRRIYQEAAAYRSRAGSNVSAAWSHVIRGTWEIQDTADGRRGSVSSERIRTVIDKLNAAAGYPRYREVPLADLAR